jgi:hypothetical protein
MTTPPRSAGFILQAAVVTCKCLAISSPVTIVMTKHSRQLMGKGRHGRLNAEGDVTMQGIVDRLLMLICCAALLPGRAYDDIAAVVACWPQ